MFNFLKKKDKPQELVRPAEPKPAPISPAETKQLKQDAHVICKSCFSDITVAQIEAAGGECPSCHAKVDLSSVPTASL